MQLLVVLSFVVSALCSTIALPAYPLAVKSPYLSTWYSGRAESFASQCPTFWRLNDLTWFVLARVNGETHRIFGCPDDLVPAASQVDLEFTSTHTYVTMQAGEVTFLLDFFSPVSLTDYVRQSTPLSYLTVTVQEAPEGAAIELLSAIDDTWTAQSDTQLEFTDGESSAIFGLSGVNSWPRSEVEDMATWGTVVFAADKRGNEVSWQSGNANEIKQLFIDNGALSSENVYEPGSLVALAYSVPSTSGSSASFVIGLEREEVVIYLNDPQTGYYRSEYPTTAEAVDYFFDDEAAARNESSELDARVVEIGQTVSQNYTDILEGSIRQIWGAFEVTIPLDTLDISKAKAFVKEISTNGNMQTVADLIPKTLPVFYKLAPDYIRLMCEPVMEYTLLWPAKFAFHDMGKHYPNATGETVEGQQKLIMDQTSVIHWMAYSYQKASGDTEWVKPYLAPMQNYADHLVANGLYPPSERSSVDAIQASPNQTTLAIYAAIGLNAFGTMSGRTNYSDIAHDYAEKILNLGYSSDRTHLKAHYGDPDESWMTAYPFGYDKMLELNTFNESTYKKLSDWYETKLNPYGMILDDRVDYMVSELAMWATATTSTTVRDNIIGGIHGAWTNPVNESPGPTQWNVTGPNTGAWFLATTKSILGSFWLPTTIE